MVVHLVIKSNSDTDRNNCTHYLVGRLILGNKHWTLIFFCAFAVLEFFCVLCFSFGSRHTSCKTYDTDSRCGICESSWLGTFNWLRINNGGFAPGLWRRTVAVKSPFAHFGVGCCWLGCCCCCWSRILNHMSCCFAVESCWTRKFKMWYLTDVWWNVETFELSPIYK